MNGSSCLYLRNHDMYKLLYVAYDLRLFMLQLLESQVSELQQVIDNDEVPLTFTCVYIQLKLKSALLIRK